MDPHDSEPIHTTLNIPQLLFVLIIGGLAIRWFLSSNSSGRNINTTATSRNRSGRESGQDGTPAASRGAGQRANLRHVETISQMFPQLDTREIMWDLQRNGNNVQTTTERILSGRGLEPPPPSFRPILPSTPTAAGTATRSAVPVAQTGPDLIQKYNLAGKLKDSAMAHSVDEPTKSTWSSSKTERQSLLQKRREEMILAARQKLVESSDRKS